jgi:hypothetical protein
VPYLHWDTDKGRTQLAKAIEKATAQHLQRRLPKEPIGDDNPHLATIAVEALARKKAALKDSRSLSTALQHTTRRGILGQYLLRVAMLSEIMACYEDEELVRGYLFANPPLHPRRTLHQSSDTHYGFLKSTDRLDKEQVVYKATAPVEQSTHRHCTRLYGCLHCRGDIRKIPRVLMVDQLWLFILDGSEYLFSKIQTYFMDIGRP